MNLNSVVMCRVLSIRLGVFRAKQLSCRERRVVLAALWDTAIRQGTLRPYEQVEQLDQVLQTFATSGAVPRSARWVKALFRCNRIRGLLVVQDSSLDWAWAVFASEAGASIYEPEGPFGSVLTSEVSLKQDVATLRTIGASVSERDLERALVSLQARTQGRFEHSYMSVWMREADMASSDICHPDSPPSESNMTGALEEPTVFVYLHVFSDMPNARVVEDSEWRPNDFLAETFQVLRELKSLNMRAVVRSHPQSQKYPMDADAISAVRQFCMGNPKMTFEEGGQPSILLASARRPVVLTARGSISVEAAFLRVPVINWQGNLYTEIGIARRWLLGTPLDVALRGIWDSDRLEFCRNESIRFEASMATGSFARIFRLGYNSTTLSRNASAAGFTPIPRPESFSR